MHVYRFRILLEDVDDFYRDIEISSGDTFESFHKAIIDAVELDGKELASFYICDSKWNRKKEITLMDMTEGEDLENAPLLMHKCKLGQFIDDPHQRIIYVYDFLNLYEFYIELNKIVPSEKGVKYPRCTKKSGSLPKTGSQILNVPSEFEEEVVFEDSPAGSDDDNEGSDLYSDSEISGFGEEGGDSSERFDDDKF